MPTTDAASDGWSNATLVARTNLTGEAATLRIRPDGALFEFEAGQYAVIGLPAGAPRCADADPLEDAVDPKKRIMRAYSIASSSRAREYVELYVTLVRSGALTPRLWMLREGDRLWLGPKAKGLFTMDGVPPETNVVLLGTGTGLAPYISMIHDHHRCNVGRKFVVVHGARYVRDLGYREELEALDCACSTLTYLPTISRVEEDSPWDGHVGRVQTVFEDGALEAALGESLDPATTHVFVSGNPEMVEDVAERLGERGFSPYAAHSTGTLHVERYW